jgi:hypothetical protein
LRLAATAYRRNADLTSPPPPPEVSPAAPRRTTCGPCRSHACSSR